MTDDDLRRAIAAVEGVGLLNANMLVAIAQKLAELDGAIDQMLDLRRGVNVAQAGWLAAQKQNTATLQALLEQLRAGNEGEEWKR